MENKTPLDYGTATGQANGQADTAIPPPYPVGSYGDSHTANNAGFQPVSAAYPPTSTAYYPPTSTGYPPVSAAYPPPVAAPPPYSATVPKYPTEPTTTQTTTVVAINDPGTSRFPSHYSSEVGFTSKSIRLGFIRKVFAILSVQLLVTVGFICLFLFVPAFEEAGRKLSIYVAAYVVFFVLYFVLVCCDAVRRSHPTNLILLSLFTLSLSYLVGVISSFHDTNIVLVMMGVTAVVTISVSLFACQTKFDMTKYGGVLFVCALVIFFVLVFSPVFLLVTTVSRIAIGGVLALLFTAFLVYDIQLVMGGRKYELSEEEYVFGALILYIDIINILIVLLYLFAGSNN